MIFDNVLKESLDSAEKLKGVPKGKWEAEHAPFTYNIHKAISGMNVFFSLPSNEGVKSYMFMYANNKDAAEIHFAIEDGKGGYSTELTNIGNGLYVMSAVVEFSKIAIRTYNPKIIYIICKDDDESRKKSYLSISKRVSSENGYIITNVLKKEFSSEHSPIGKLSQVIVLERKNNGR